MNVKKWGKPQIIIMEKQFSKSKTFWGQNFNLLQSGALTPAKCISNPVYFLFPIYRPLYHWFTFVVCGFVERVLQTSVSLSLDLWKFYNCLSICLHESFFSLFSWSVLVILTLYLFIFSFFSFFISHTMFLRWKQIRTNTYLIMNFI